MATIAERIQSADWKNEKHAPAISCADHVRKGERLSVSATVGKEIPHPNTTEHHIAWIQLYFQPDGDKFTYHIATSEFVAHAASAKGPNEGPALSEPSVTSQMTLNTSGTLIAMSYCNIHGLWESSTRITVA